MLTVQSVEPRALVRVPAGRVRAEAASSPKYTRCAAPIAGASPDSRSRTAAYCRIGSSRRYRPCSSGATIRDCSDQTSQGAEHVEVVAGDPFGRGQGETAGEDGKPAEQPLLIARQQGVAPVQRRLHGLLPFGEVAAAAGADGLVQSFQQRRRVEQTGVRRR